MSAVSIRHRLTVADLYRMAEAGILAEDDRVELIAGELIAMPPMGPLHAGVADLLEEILRAGLGQAVAIRPQQPLRLSDDTELELDGESLSGSLSANRADGAPLSTSPWLYARKRDAETIATGTGGCRLAVLAEPPTGHFPSLGTSA